MIGDVADVLVIREGQIEGKRPIAGAIAASFMVDIAIIANVGAAPFPVGFSGYLATSHRKHQRLHTYTHPNTIPSKECSNVTMLSLHLLRLYVTL